MTDAEYGFYDRLTKDFPSQIIVDITEVCNLECIHCPHSEFKKSDLYAARKLSPELNKKMVDEVAKYGQGKTQYIRYTSDGEPLLHPQCYEMIEYAIRNSGVYVTLTTNGTIMNDEKIQRLLKAGVHMIDISLDAYKEETYSKIRRKGDLNVTRANVLNLIKWKKELNANTKVVVSFVEQSDNKTETKDFEAFWKEQGADYVLIRRLHTFSGAKEGLAEQKRQTINVDRRPCLYPWERIVLNANGDLAYCPTEWGHRAFIADYEKTTINKVWQGEFYQKLRDAHLSNDYLECAFCGQCPDWESTRWPNEGRSYANMVEDFIKDKD